jgi:hypothetical protein
MVMAEGLVSGYHIPANWKGIQRIRQGYQRGKDQTNKRLPPRTHCNGHTSNGAAYECVEKFTMAYHRHKRTRTKKIRASSVLLGFITTTTRKREMAVGTISSGRGIPRPCPMVIARGCNCG